MTIIFSRIARNENLFWVFLTFLFQSAAMSQSRQLAAIMFTDIEGYTAIMQQNEQQALSLRKRHREVLQKEHTQYDGRIIQYYGDGTLSIFQSAIQAVQCGVAMQQAFCRAPRVPLRIGLHIGDVIFDDDQVVGDGVNLASRIESLGIAGCVLISDRVKEEIRNHPELKTVSVGSYQFKNIERRVEVFALDHEDLIIPKPYSLEGKTEDKESSYDRAAGKHTSKSIAVLPFVNMSNDPDQEYFGEGMAEEILNSLVHLKDLKVAGRTSSFQFKGRNIDLREVGQKLGVSSVLEGSVRKQGNRLRVTAQLINVEDGFHLWSERYDREMDDIFGIQDEIALFITEKLKVTLLEEDYAIVTKTHTTNTEAYELYLKGRFYLSRRGSFIMAAMENFKNAISLDPGFALAYAGYADALNLAAFYGFLPGKEIMKDIKRAAGTAIGLDGSLCEPYCALGGYYTGVERNWMEAKRNFTKGLELNPRYAQGHSWYGMLYLTWVEGKFDEAGKQGQLAIKLEPLSAIDHADLSWTMYTAGKFDEALAIAQTGIELDANSFLSHRLAGLACIGLNRNEEAIETFKNLAKISGRHQHSITGLIWAYCNDKNFEEARKLMDELRARSVTEYITPTYLGIAAAWLGDMDNAFDLLQKAYDDLDPNMTQLKYSPYGPTALRNDTRFQNLLNKIGYPG
jgi:TolB-like protein/class 3 adenylate cyclase/Tfp pilus assembly protein PilF